MTAGDNNDQEKGERALVLGKGEGEGEGGGRGRAGGRGPQQALPMFPAMFREFRPSQHTTAHPPPLPA